MSNYHNKFYIISASSLALFQDCPRCFYLQVKEGLRRPQGPPPALHTRMDGLIKEYFDKFRLQNRLPPQIEGRIEGKLFSNLDLLNKWRNWQTSLFYEDRNLKVRLVGALDDCVVTEDGFFIPLDYKTKGYIRENSHTYHQTQLNIYTFLLDENGYTTKDFGYLIFFAPNHIEDDNIIKFDIEVRRVETSKDKAKELLQKAVLTLNGSIPSAHQNCEYCLWVEDLHELF